MGTLTDNLESFKAGRISFGQLRDFIVSFRFKVPRRFGSDRPKKMGHLEQFVDDHTPIKPEEDTWDEVSNAQARGVLTNDQYYALSEAMDEKP